MIGNFYPFLVMSAVQPPPTTPVNVVATSATTEIQNAVEMQLVWE